MKTIIISNPQGVEYVKSEISKLPLDGSYTVEIKKTDKSSSGKQRRLNWMWCSEVAKSGIGSRDTKDGVYIESKWRFARPILLRDNEIFGVLYHYFIEVASEVEGFSEKCIIFTTQYISIEKMSMANRAEYMRDFQNYWTRKGVNLTDPDLLGLDLDKY